jgi:anti-sigma factor RsiW
MNCELWQDKIDAFVDSELVNGQARGFEEHLRSCPACSAETLARQRLKLETRLAGQRFTPTPEFEARIRRKVAPRRRTSWIWMPALASAAAVLIIAILAGQFWRQNLIQRQLVAQLTDQHVATLASGNLDVLSTDSHTVKPWFAGKVPFSVDTPNLEGTQFTLVGGRMAYFQQIPAAQLLFAVRKHRISVFIFRDAGETAALGNQTSPVRKMGFQTQTWVEDGLRYFAISDVNGDDVRQLCDLLKRSSSS